MILINNTYLSKCEAEISNFMYANNTEPAIVAIPLAITQCNSEGVIWGKNGFIVSGASVCPKSILAAAFIDSQGVVPMVI